MDVDQTLLNNARKLVELLDLIADKTLPQQIVDVVKTHAKLAVGSAWIPIPGVDVAASAASIWGMYIRINNKTNLPFGENVIKSIGSGVATNLASFAAVTATGSLLKLIPGIGQIGGAVLMSAAMYAATLASGWIYLTALTKLAERKKGKNITESDLKNGVNEVLKDKSSIKDFIDSAKKSYKR